MNQDLIRYQDVNLSDISDQISVSSDEVVKIRRQESRIKKYHPNSCKYCHAKFIGSQPKKICNSHSIPRFILRGIGNNLNNINTFVHFPWEDPLEGVNSAGTFRLLCTECDGRLFQEYENPLLYDVSFLATCNKQKIMNEIAMKNYLFSMYLHLNEELYYKQEYCSFDELKIEEKVYLKKQMDIENENITDARSGFARAKKCSDDPLLEQSDVYEIIYFHIFDYEFNIAFQDKITIEYDCWGNRVNDLWNYAKSTDDIHLVIFPVDGKTFVLAFSEVKGSRLARTIKCLREITDHRLAAKALISMVMISSNNFFISSSVTSEVFKHDYLRKLSGDLGLVRTEYSGENPVSMSEVYSSLPRRAHSSQSTLVGQYEKIPDQLLGVR